MAEGDISYAATYTASFTHENPNYWVMWEKTQCEEDAEGEEKSVGKVTRGRFEYEPEPEETRDAIIAGIEQDIADDRGIVL